MKKRTVCRYYSASGSCYYGDQCQFSHSQPAYQASRFENVQGNSYYLTEKKGGTLSRLTPEPPAVRKDPPENPDLAPTGLTLVPSKMRSSSAVELGSTGLGRGAALGKRASLGGGVGGGATLQVQKQQPSPGAAGLKPNSPSRPQVPTVSCQAKSNFRARERPPYRYPQSIAYTQSPSSMARSEGFFVPEQLRQELLRRQAMCLTMPLEGTCPTEVEHYHSLCMLESPSPPDVSSMQGQISTCYRAISSRDNLYYCLKRIHGYKLTNKRAIQALEKWKHVQHSNLVSLKEMFTTKAFKDNSLVLVYDFHPGADTMANHIITSKDSHPGLPPEETLWDYIIQLVSGLRAVHGMGLAIGYINLTKVLVTSTSRHRRRVRINCCGLMDILSSEASVSDTIHLEQQKDLICLGHLVLCLALKSPVAAQPENFTSSMETIKTNYSTDIQNLVQYLCNSTKPPVSLSDVASIVEDYVYTSLDRTQFHQDLLEEELSKEVENGRLFRLLAKLGFINERPEHAGDIAWSETGDQYLLKLFRDYLFHQVLPTGSPWIDLAHIVQTLNKLDVGSPENITLHSRDEQSLLVISYAELKRCLDTAFGELLSSSESH